ncbi:glycosyltransferase [Pectobacterium aroidearum]|uniref:glycosyltransferase n=1 Tax=Pectobacterium aroidearum TaxID=1201031 RepID=UPI0015DE804D|nr:glycosyltransferase [Pectobacterium aroidearum]MBA0205339.1 glycosyltransferase [Pectobacterium aroidearum]
MKITAVIVTYANRVQLVTQVVDECMLQGIDRIVLIDNGSPSGNKEKLRTLQNKYTKNNIFIHENESNEGSAAGFAKGLRLAVSLSEKDSWVLVLDDDNKLESGVVGYLRHIGKQGNMFNAYSCFRADREHYNKFIQTNDIKYITGKPNSFMLFSISEYLKEKIRLTPNSRILSSSEDFIPIPCGPYGGLFISVAAISMAGYPNESLYLYFDDTEYTLKLKEKGIALFLARKSIIRDIDTSWGSETKKGFSYHPAFIADKFRVFYSYRNRVYVEKKYFVKNIFLYQLNMFFSLFILFVKALISGNMSRFLFICKSVMLGWVFDKDGKSRK